MIEVYKIVIEGNNGRYKTLFHGINGSKLIPLDEWLKADIKLVKDGSGGNKYYSGFHCFETKELGEKYLKRFRTEQNRVLIKCDAKFIRHKPSNKEVWLAEEIKIYHKNRSEKRIE